MKAVFLAIILLFTQNLFAESALDSAQNNLDEDALILEALDARDLGDDKRAVEIYQTLYKNTKKIEYLKEQLFALVRLEKHKDALDSANEVLNLAPEDLEALKVKAFLLKDNADSAISILQKVVALENNAINNTALANLYMQKNDFARARECLLRAYNDNQNENILLLLANIDLKMGALDLELFRAHFGDEVNEVFAHLLLESNASENALASLETLFLDFYTRKKTKINAKNLAKVYFLQNKLEKINALAREFDFDEAFLIDIYIAKKDYKNAKKSAQKALKRTKDNHYLGVLAIIEFESSEDKASKIPQIVADLELALKDNPNHIFANYLGYLLIDYEIDVPKGIDYVKRALDLMPQNPAYLDSLAWGYFKQGKCKEASEILEQIPREIIEREAEIKGHLEDIKKCLEKSLTH